MMAREEGLKKDIDSFIDNADKIDDLRSILYNISLNKIKSMLKEHINKLNSSEIAAMFYESLPMTNILDVDVLQYIISFNSLKDVQPISSLFLQLSKANEQQLYTNILSIHDTMRRTAKQHQFEYQKLNKIQNKVTCQITYHSKQLSQLKQSQQQTYQKMVNMHDETYNTLKQIQVIQKNTNTSRELFCPETTIIHIKGFTQEFIIDDTYTDLNQHINEMTKQYSSGDKIIFRPGRYKWSTPWAAENIFFPQSVKDIHLIGIGDVVFNIASRSFIEIKSHQNIWFENICFCFGDREYREEYEGFIRLNEESTVWANKCKFQCPERLISILIEPKADLYIKQCVFDGGNPAVSINPYSNVTNIIDCTFMNCGGSTNNMDKACVEIENDDENRQFYSRYNLLNDASLKLTCNGNTFINNNVYAFGAKCTYFGEKYTSRGYISHWVNNFDPSNHCVMKNNVLKENNCSTEPNKIYIRIVDDPINY